MMRRPKILVITTIPETLAAFFVPQLRHLHEAGFAVKVVSSPGAALEALALPEGVHRHGIAMERQPSPRRDLASLWQLYRLMRAERPEIVHAHTPKAGLLGMAAAALAGVPARLYTVHGLPLLTRSGWRRRLLEGAEKASAWLATDTYAVSESVRDLLAYFGICRRARVLGDGSCGGVDVERFCPRPELRGTVRRELGLPQDAVVLTFVGRLAQDKGIAILAEAWAEMALQAPQLHLLLAGDGDASDPVPAAVLEGLRSHPRVHMTGAIPQARVPAIYAATDIAVLPTYREGLSQLALEAGASGVPLVASRVSGMDAVRHEVTGLLVRAGKAAELRAAVLKLVLDDAGRKQLGAAAREHICEKYSEQRVNGLWMQEYLRLSERRAGPGLGRCAAHASGREL